MFLWQGAAADDTTTGEYAALLRIDRQLAELTPLIEAAEQAADPDARVRFRFDWLRRDIATIRRGVQAQLHSPLAEQQANAPLHSDYQR